MLDQSFDRRASERHIKRIVYIRSETKHYLFLDASSLVFSPVSTEVIEVIPAGQRFRVELIALHFEHTWSKTVGTTMTASSVWVCGQRSIFARLSGWSVDI
jgi:hypothetical protein